MGNFEFHRLPHPLDMEGNVGDPLSKGFYSYIEEGMLHPTRFFEEFNALLVAKKITRFWGNYRARFDEQVAIWYDEQGEEGAIAPSVIPTGTVTRRAVHKLWLTAINPKDDEIIGADLKSMIECPDGFYIVGADVDSQEQWIAALIGDSASGRNAAGATPFSNMLLAGNKADQSDLHSVVAKEVGISRDKAKVLNYARLYGSGIKHAQDFLKQSGINSKSAEQIARTLFSRTKGKQLGYFRLSPFINDHFEYYLRNICDESNRCHHIFLNGFYFLPDFRSKNSKLTLEFEQWIINEIKNAASDEFDETKIIKTLYADNHDLHQLFTNGFESETFNYLEEVVRQEHPRTPILNCRLGSALEPLPKSVPGHENFIKKYRRSIINWVVQSSAVDFLHLLLCCMKWLCDEYDINARFAISIHDEVRYIASAKDRYRCALALSLSNMYVRAMISEKLGINQLPMSVAFFSQVDIDKVLRKEVGTICRTPDGKIIPAGEALDMKSILLKTGGGSLGKSS